MRPPARTIARSDRGPPSSASSEGAIGSGTQDGQTLARDAAAHDIERSVQGGSNVLVTCEATLDGILTATGLGYLAHAPAGAVRLAAATSAQARLDEQVVVAPTDEALARRVWRGFARAVTGGCPRARNGSCERGCANGCTWHVVLAAASEDASMPEVLHRYLRAGFSLGSRLRDNPAAEDVAPAHDLARAVSAECERMRQFARFSHMQDGLYLATIEPKADVLPLMVGYFTARLGTERFCVVDPRHRVAALHEAGGHTSLVRLDEGDARALSARKDLAADERYVRAMWKRLYDGLALAGRDRTHRGYDLRQQFMPQRLWSLLPELDPTNDDAGGYVPERYGGPAQVSGSHPQVPSVGGTQEVASLSDGTASET